ncbi:MAG: hypothetical protein ACI92E_002743 [Oceanicoccus sp.]
MLVDRRILNQIVERTISMNKQLISIDPQLQNREKYFIIVSMYPIDRNIGAIGALPSFYIGKPVICALGVCIEIIQTPNKKSQ